MGSREEWLKPSCYQDFYYMLHESLPVKLFWHCKSNQIAGNVTYCKMYFNKLKGKSSLGRKTFWLQLSYLPWPLPSFLFFLSPKSKPSLRSKLCFPETFNCLPLLFLPFFSRTFEFWNSNDLYKKNDITYNIKQVIWNWNVFPNCASIFCIASNEYIQLSLL